MFLLVKITFPIGHEVQNVRLPVATFHLPRAIREWLDVSPDISSVYLVVKAQWEVVINKRSHTIIYTFCFNGMFRKLLPIFSV